MREIKFRCWNKKENKMYYPETRYVFEEYPLFIDGLTKKHNFIYQQFTGLLDKNGKEIFEGDIVKSISFDHEMAINEIIYNEKECAFTLKSGFLFARYENEVIGNIYENPDLILKTSE